jgi:hypothetical protein
MMTEGEDEKHITIGEYQDSGREPTVSDLYDIDASEAAEWLDRLDQDYIGSDKSGVSVNLGEEYHRTEISSTLWDELEESGISRESVDVVYIETRRFGFVENGGEELFSKAYETQKSPNPRKKQEVNPTYIVVPTPVRENWGERSTKEDILTQLEYAQEKIENHPDVTEFDGEILLENRNESHLQGISDVRQFDELGNENLRYSVNISEDGGWEMINNLPSERIAHIRLPEYDFENLEEYKKI